MSDSYPDLAVSPDLFAQLQGLGVQTVILGGTDTHGVMRGKRVPLEQLPRILEHGLPLCDVFWVMHVDESDLVARPAGHRGYFPTEAQGYPDILAVPDVTTVRLVPWHPDTALLLCDWTLPHHGGAVPLCPRGVLKQVVGRAEAMGYQALSALELEFYVLREKCGTRHLKRADELVPLQEAPSTYGVVLGSLQESTAGLIRSSMLEYGLPIEACNPETGPGQFEINLRYAPSLRAADDAFLFKSAVKEVVSQQELLATFMAKPSSAWAGNSCHVHVSLRDDQGKPVFADPDQAEGISETMRHFAGGVLATMAQLTAVMAPTPNSYRRYVPYSWAGTTATWGVDNRSTGLRAICEGPEGTRLEHRQPGGDANPYLATAALLAGGLHGIERRIEPPALTDFDVYARPNGDFPGLPRTLDEAVGLLDDSEIARRWLGADFVDHYVAMKRAEIAAQATAVTDWEIARYLEAL